MTRSRSLIAVLGPLAGALLAVAAGVVAGDRFGPGDGYLAGVLVAMLIAGGYVALTVEPAVTISVGLALGIFSGRFGELGSPIGIDRVILVAGILAVLVREWRADERRLRVRGIHLGLLVIAVYAVASAIFVGRLKQNEPFFGLVDYLGLIPFALFWVAPAAFPTARERRILLASYVAVGLYLGLTAVLETTGPSALVFPSYITNPDVGIHFGRARGPFVEAAGNGLSMYFCAVAASIALVQWRRWRWVPALAIALCAAGILFTLTRQIWLAAAVATIAAMAARRQLRLLLVPTVVAGALAVVVLLSFVPGFSGRAQSRFDDPRPVWDRLNSNAAAMKMIERRPLVGWGWYGFGVSSGPYYRQAPDYPLTTVGRVHNVFLGYAVDLGLFATIAWVIAVGVAIAGGLARRGPPDLDHWRVGLVAVAVAWAVVANFTPMGYAFDHATLWLWAGLCWSRT